MELNRFREITSGFADRNVLVVGDIMLDTYLWGDINRVSPEAPVPIVEVNKIEHNPCLLYTSDAADDTPCVDLGGRRIIK